ncbi:hypothetical protein CONCODRAFT_80196 [Conidiobolus coronatus NRRL 28638]|uniref:C2H2-type domain-containing protein n=1 Tax=Conidiobolus coronatus (strain ATCC 28846 / CBS 209.66 / NRRL 28638) TaxID=796925 RepID=A0A137NWY1_CONC2|nr:hypothetical protein CONCODRAFT_80196 [Conidiobolus coronatus NRRL 28638]|eukprot:KXN67350.1 hypothetical protein CONCODRAFT_80196 [Conidiobolus coronatus NRRL 28638]
MKLIKNIKPREWRLERISKLSDDSSNIGVSTWKPASSRKIRPIILPSAIPISRPPRQLYHTQHQHQYQNQHQHHQVSQSSLTASSRNIQPHTIPAPTNVNKTVTANRGAIPVLSFIDENGNKRLQCPGKDCPKHFADRCGLNRHKKKYHPELEPLGSSSTSQLNS